MRELAPHGWDVAMTTKATVCSFKNQVFSSALRGGATHHCVTLVDVEGYVQQVWLDLVR